MGISAVLDVAVVVVGVGVGDVLLHRHRWSFRLSRSGDELSTYRYRTDLFKMKRNADAEQRKWWRHCRSDATSSASTPGAVSFGRLSEMLDL